MPTELLIGFLIGLAGALVAYLLRSLRLSWGILWSATGSLGLAIVTPNWLTSLPYLRQPIALAVLILLAGLMASCFGLRQGYAEWLTLVSIAGIWASVPDTEAISLLLGMTGPLALAAHPLRLLSLDRLGGGLVGGILVTTVFFEGGSRVPAIVGGLGSLAALGLVRRRERQNVWLFVRHLVLVAFWARVAARAPSGTWALVWGVSFTLIVIGAQLIWRRLEPVMRASRE